MRSLEQAQRDVLAAVPPLPVLEIPVWDALGLGLASPVVAPHDVPPFTNSAMDGYAVQGADVEEAPVTLRLLEDVPAGHVAHQAVRSGAAIKIMTGAPIPEGADTVVKVEDTTPLPDGVRIMAATPAGTAVRPAGGRVAAGAPVFDAGERLTAPHLAVLASLGVSPRVHRRPRVAMLSTGDEVLPPETGHLGPGQIRDTNRPLLAAMLDELGVEVVDLGIVGDDAVVLRDTLERGAGEADMVLTSGGVSMGEYDLVKIILRELGTIDFWKVAMQPAKPFAFGHIEGTPLLGLPGNPVSVMVAFEQFARPALLQMMGCRAVFRAQAAGRAAEAWRTDPAKTVFARVVT
ncbi:MAG: molybdopterin molybdotransferase MoeA, partial [Acidimicrobiia bacterium]|nr:molybdopterin molybdotransferase MoeA [Acidimicrobiia bacterium]